MKVISDPHKKKRQGFKRTQVNGYCDTKDEVICVTTIDGSQNDWVLDYACSFYVYANKKLFNRYKPYNASDVVETNGSRSEIISMGTVKVKMFDGILEIR